ncbi:MAG: YgfZ/GcvT domain-containing protein [Alphaproteobacteria bacterium]
MNDLDPARAFLTVTGAEAASFLQAIITQDIHTAREDALIFSALLSPQGKWMFDFFIRKIPEGFQIECAADARDALIKKLTLYKLRAKVEIAPLEGWRVGYASPTTHHAPRTTAFADPRHPALPQRVWLMPNAPEPDDLLPLNEVNEQRLTLGIPEGGLDATPDETLLDLGYDLLHAVSFTKGCYVGQEVTARMHYKQIARKGFYHVRGAQPLSAHARKIETNDETIGDMRSRQGHQGLMFGRFDVVENTPNPQLDGKGVTLTVPDWLRPRLTLFLANR